MNSEDHILNIFFGFIGLFVLAIVGSIIYLISLNFKAALGVVSGISAIILVSWVIGYFINSYSRWKEAQTIAKISGTKQEPEKTIKLYNVRSLDRLFNLERKYGISTLHFMYLVHKDEVPIHINNLDHIEWIGLVNEMASLRAKDKNGEKDI